MGRGATKAADNPWCKARMEAAKWDKRLCSREGAAELLGMSVSAVADAELGNTKVMPVDKAVLMADLYNAPALLNYYCMNECPIGSRRSLSSEELEIDRVTVKILKRIRLDDLRQVRRKLLDIADDGQVTEDEIDDLIEVVDFFRELQRTSSELEIICEKVTSRRTRK